MACNCNCGGKFTTYTENTRIRKTGYFRFQDLLNMIPRDDIDCGDKADPYLIGVYNCTGTVQIVNNAPPDDDTYDIPTCNTGDPGVITVTGATINGSGEIVFDAAVNPLVSIQILPTVFTDSVFFLLKIEHPCFDCPRWISIYFDGATGGFNVDLNFTV